MTPLNKTKIKSELEKLSLEFNLETHSRNDFYCSPLFRDFPPQGEK